MENPSFSKATLSRLPDYLNFLKRLDTSEMPFISATCIAKNLSLGEVMVRKDLNTVSGNGKPKLGYRTAELVKCIENCLGLNDLTPAVLVGAGKLGRALLEYDEFQKYGVKILAAFDCSDQVLRYNGAIEILPMSCFDDFCKTYHIRLGIITVGEGSAQNVCDQMLNSGITAIWNFAPCKLDIPEGILYRQENLALSLAHLNRQLCNQIQEDRKETNEA